ncbi:MAG: response regulator [Hyphomonadaceae bacterium]
MAHWGLAMNAPMAVPILVVDDYGTMVRIVRGLLSQLGFQHVDAAADGEAALAKLRERRYGLVISDAGICGGESRGLLRALRADAALCETPVLMMTQGEGNESEDAPSAAFLPRPFNLAMLRERMKLLLHMEL